MTSATLNRVSLVTEFDVPFREPDPRHFLNPAGYEPEFSRVLLHEAVHYWQQLSQMALLLVADEDWERLRRFRSSGRVDPPGVLSVAYRQPHASLGFSALDLAESAARYWDVLSVGPHNLVDMELAAGREPDAETSALYERALTAGAYRTPDGGFTDLSVVVAMRFVGGRYAAPYLYLRDQLGELMPMRSSHSLRIGRCRRSTPSSCSTASRRWRVGRCKGGPGGNRACSGSGPVSASSSAISPTINSGCTCCSTCQSQSW